MHPWRNWIAHQIPILTVGGSSPPGCTTKKHLTRGAFLTAERKQSFACGFSVRIGGYHSKTAINIAVLSYLTGGLSTFR